MADWKLKIDVERPDVKGAQAALKKLFRELDNIQKIANKADKAIEEAVQVKKPKAISFKDIVGANFLANIGSRGAAGAVRLLTTAVGLYADAAKRAVTDSAAFENSIVSIARISGSTEKSIAAMSNEFRLLSTTVPVSVKEFQKFAETASRFGIKGTEGITQFAKTFGRLQSIVGPVSDATTKSVARIASITGYPIEEIDKFANSVIVLGKNFATSEEQIIRTAERIAQDTSQFGASAEEVLGLATALDALGIKSEKGGSALLRVLDAIQGKAIQAGSDFERLADISGIASDEFSRMSVAAPVKAFELLIASGADGSEIMDRLGLAGVRVQSVLSALTKKSDLFSKAMRNASDSIKDNNVLLGDAAKQAETNESKIARLGNAFESTFIGIGSSATDQTGELLDKVLQMTDAFIGLDKEAVKAFPQIASLGEEAKSLFQTGLGVADKLVDAFKESAPLIEQWAKRLEGAAKTIGKIAQFADEVGAVGTTVFDVVTNPTGAAASIFGGDARAEDQADIKARDDRASQKEIDDIFKDIPWETVFNVNDIGLSAVDISIAKWDEVIQRAAIQSEIDSKRLKDNLNVVIDKLIESQRSGIDATNKKADSVTFETGLKSLGLDDIDKRRARLEKTFLENQKKLLDAGSFEGADTLKVDEALNRLVDSFNKLDDALVVSGLIDDIARFNKELDKNAISSDKLTARRDNLNLAEPQVAAITDVVSAGKFISESREAEKADSKRKEDLRLQQDQLDTQKKILQTNIDSARDRIKVVTIR